MSANESYDVIVLGGGMAGLPVSIRSAWSGSRTAVVEDDLLGGTCLNRGCIPTKTMIRSDQAKEQGYEVAIGRSEYAEQGKPKALGETEGFVKIVSDAETDGILGGHIVGEGGADLVHEIAVAMNLGGTTRDIADTIHVHPTLPEVVNSAAGGVQKPS